MTWCNCIFRLNNGYARLYYPWIYYKYDLIFALLGVYLDSHYYSRLNRQRRRRGRTVETEGRDAGSDWL